MTVKDFGITKDGIATKLYTLKNNNLEISVTDFGSTLVSIVVPDRNNKPTDIVLGYDDVSGYETDLLIKVRRIVQYITLVVMLEDVPTE